MMTIDQLMKKAEAGVEDFYLEGLARAERIMLDHGATDEELEVFMARHRVDLAASLADGLVKLRAWLERDCEPLH